MFPTIYSEAPSREFIGIQEYLYHMINVKDKKPELCVIMPALNEQNHILDALRNSLCAFDDHNINGEIVVINDGSTDDTMGLVAAEAEGDERVRLIDHDTPMGIGASFWEGVENARADFVVMLPGDNENDPWEIFRYFRLLEQVDLVIPFVFNKEVRSLYRNGLSYLYRFIINTTFHVYFNYTNGTVLYRKALLEEMEYRSEGFFFQTDILIRSAKRGYLFAEVPYQLGTRKAGLSKATTFPSFVQVMRGYLRLVRDYYFKTKSMRNTPFAEDSMTARRYGSENIQYQKTEPDDE